MADPQIPITMERAGELARIDRAVQAEVRTGIEQAALQQLLGDAKTKREEAGFKKEFSEGEHWGR